MELIRGLSNLKPLGGCALTIGNFDGLHVGHQQIINKLVAQAKALNLPSVVISFAPTPQQFFGKTQSGINSFRQKHQLLSELGVDKHLLIKFNQSFSQISAEQFISEILLAQLGVKYCLVGDDFRFGAKRAGDYSLLKAFGAQHGFVVENTESVVLDQQRVSSSKIREHLAQGQFSQARAMLGRDFNISGKIIKGQQLGRTIDFPTINIAIKRRISPVLGVFAVRVNIDNVWHQGVCNIGTRPTVSGKGVLLEAFIFDFAQNVYHKQADVVFLHKLRDEQKFDSFEALKQQIALDVESARAYFNS